MCEASYELHSGRKASVDFEPKYSKSQLHFVSSSPDWIPLVVSTGDFSSILDLGAGDGRNSLHLRRSFPRARIVALDASVIRCIRCRRAVDAMVVHGNGLTLPFESASFDLIVSTQVIEHVPHDRAFLSEIARVVKSEGICVVSSVIKMRFSWYFYRNRAGQWVLDPTHVREYGSVEEYTDLFAEQFEILYAETRQIRFSPIRFLFRLLMKLNLIMSDLETSLSTGACALPFGRWEVPIPGYRRVIVVAERRQTPQASFGE